MIDEDEVAVRCSEASHSDRVVQIAEFKPKGDGAWTLMPVVSRRSKPRDEQVLVEFEERTKYRFKCRLCGLSKTYREENLFKILDKLRVHGIKTVELRMLPSDLARL